MTRYCRCQLKLIPRPGRIGLFCPTHGAAVDQPDPVVVADFAVRVPEDAEVERVREQWRVPA